MQKATCARVVFPAKHLAFTSLFSALCFVATMLVVIPLPNGYFNAGDVFVLLAGWCLGPLYGAIAGAVGSALADICSGFALYAPATFFIKGATALIGYYAWLLCKKVVTVDTWDFIPRLCAVILAESVMVLGYFCFETALYGVAGAVLSLLGNSLQGICCGLLAVSVCKVLCSIKGVKKLFPRLF